MFKFLRSRAKVFYWVIASTFILFLFLGGMTSRGCNAPGTRQSEPGVIGYVNGTRITSQMYQMAVSQQMNMMRQQAQCRGQQEWRVAGEHSHAGKNDRKQRQSETRACLPALRLRDRAPASGSHGRFSGPRVLGQHRFC